MIVFVRHGKTESNNVGHEKLRGWLPVPLSLEGMEQAEEIAYNLSGLEDVKEICCGTLVRVVQTAQEVAEALEMEISPCEELNDWNTGEYAGRGVPETLKTLHDHIQYPLKPVKGGEPFQFFLDRIVPVLNEKVKSKDLYVVISSGRVATLLKALSRNKGKEPDTDILLGKPPISPAGILIVDANWRITYTTEKEPGEKSLS